MKIWIKLTSNNIVFKFGDYVKNLQIYKILKNARIWRSINLGPVQVSKRLIWYAHKLFVCANYIRIYSWAIGWYKEKLLFKF